MEVQKLKPGDSFHLRDANFFGGGDLFLRVPDCIKRDKKLNALDKLLWSQLAWFDWQYGQVFPKLETLGRELGCSITSIKDALKRLRQAGYISWESPSLTQKRKRRSNKYCLLWRHEFVSGAESAPESGADFAHESGTDSAYESEAESVPESEADSAHDYDYLTTKKKDYYHEDPDQPTAPEKECGSGGSDFGMSEEQAEYIELELKRAQEQGEIRTTSSRYRQGLVKRARNGELDISDLQELRERYKAPEQRRQEIQTLKDKQAQAQQQEQAQAKKIQEGYQALVAKGKTAQQACDLMAEGCADAAQEDLTFKALQQICPEQIRRAQEKKRLSALARLQAKSPVRRHKARETIDRLRGLDPDWADYLLRALELEEQIAA